MRQYSVHVNTADGSDGVNYTDDVMHDVTELTAWFAVDRRRIDWRERSSVDTAIRQVDSWSNLSTDIHS